MRELQWPRPQSRMIDARGACFERESPCSVKLGVSNEIHDVTILARLWCPVCTIQYIEPLTAVFENAEVLARRQ